MDKNAILTITGNYGSRNSDHVCAYLQTIKKVIIGRFMDLAEEGLPPDFDKYSPDDIMILTWYKDGSCNVIPAGKQFVISG